MRAFSRQIVANKTRLQFSFGTKPKDNTIHSALSRADREPCHSPWTSYALLWSALLNEWTNQPTRNAGIYTCFTHSLVQTDTLFLLFVHLEWNNNAAAAAYRARGVKLCVRANRATTCTKTVTPVCKRMHDRCTFFISECGKRSFCSLKYYPQLMPGVYSRSCKLRAKAGTKWLEMSFCLRGNVDLHSCLLFKYYHIIRILGNQLSIKTQKNNYQPQR